MRTVDLIPVPPELAAEVERRRAIGADTHDEVWDGEYRMAPAARSTHGMVQMEVASLLRPLGRRAGLTLVGEFNVGVPRDFRVPDLGLLRSGVGETWLSTAALVVEVLSPGDPAWEKLPFYAAHEVDEVVIVDPADRSVAWLAREGDGYEPVTRSAVLAVDGAEVADQIEWP